MTKYRRSHVSLISAKRMLKLNMGPFYYKNKRAKFNWISFLIKILQIRENF